MVKDEEFAFSIFQMEWERSRDIDDKAKHIATVSAVIVGLIYTSLSITQQTLFLFEAASIAASFFILSICFSTFAIFYLNTKSSDMINFTSLFKVSVEKKEGDKEKNSLFEEISEQFKNLNYMNNNKFRLLIIAFGMFIIGILSLTVGGAAIKSPIFFNYGLVVIAIGLILVFYMIRLILKQIPE